MNPWIIVGATVGLVAWRRSSERSTASDGRAPDAERVAEVTDRLKAALATSRMGRAPDEQIRDLVQALGWNATTGQIGDADTSSGFAGETAFDSAEQRTAKRAAAAKSARSVWWIATPSMQDDPAGDYYITIAGDGAVTVGGPRAKDSTASAPFHRSGNMSLAVAWAKRYTAKPTRKDRKGRDVGGEATDFFTGAAAGAGTGAAAGAGLGTVTLPVVGTVGGGVVGGVVGGIGGGLATLFD